MREYPTLAAVDLGSNSFRLEVARVEGDQVYPLDSLKETIRLAAGLGRDNMLGDDAQTRALACLKRFGERLRGLPQEAVRVVGTNTLRVAKNSAAFMERAEGALGFPIDIIAGREEARLIYLGVSHCLPLSDEKRLVVDIGGGSTELITGQRFASHTMESLPMGCVSYSQRYFPDGRITPAALAEAELAARTEVRGMLADFSSGQWERAYGSSGTARALAEIMEANGFSAQGITAEGLSRLREALLKAKDGSKLQLAGLRPDRVPVLPGGFAIMSAVFAELRICEMFLSSCALREGVLYDLLGRMHDQDTRDVTAKQFMQRYHVDGKQAMRVEELARAFLEQLAEDMVFEDYADALQSLGWAAQLHEAGRDIAHGGYHKHGAYILANADMPGFSKTEQAVLSLLVLGQRGSLSKVQSMVSSMDEWGMILSLRLAVLLYRGRTDSAPPRFHLRCSGQRFELALEQSWLVDNLLVETMLLSEAKEWRAVGMEFKFTSLDDGLAIRGMAKTAGF
ncbi:MAG: exopolyphosphatase [Sulfuricellaceae bacterium]|nr:exopolyphosphatase [Sulfuricellaceae bacterium]